MPYASDRSTLSWEGLLLTLVIKLSISVFNPESPILAPVWKVFLILVLGPFLFCFLLVDLDPVASDNAGDKTAVRSPRRPLAPTRSLQLDLGPLPLHMLQELPAEYQFLQSNLIEPRTGAPISTERAVDERDSQSCIICGSGSSQGGTVYRAHIIGKTEYELVRDDFY